MEQRIAVNKKGKKKNIYDRTRNVRSFYNALSYYGITRDN